MQNRNLMIAAGLVALLTTAHASAAPRDGARAFEKMDANGDGIVTTAEADAQRDAMFKRLDADGDGTLTAAERDQAKARMERMRERMAAQGQDMLAKADTNGDGNLSRAEFDAAPHGLLQRADANGDGQMTRAEFDGFVASKRGAVSGQ